MLQTKKLESDAAETRAKALQSDLAGLDAEREKLNAQLVETAALIQRSEGQLTSIEGRLSNSSPRKSWCAALCSSSHGQISQHSSAALQRMGRNPPPVLATGVKTP